MKKCECRFCQKVYDEDKSRADYKGYCSQKCFHSKAKQLGWKKGMLHIPKGYKTVQTISEYDYLWKRGETGSVFVKGK